MSASRQDSSEVEPIVGAGQLDEFFRELRQTVLDLENAYQNDRLSHRLDEIDLKTRFGSAIAKSYDRLARDSNRSAATNKDANERDPQGRRSNTIHDLLSQMREDLFDIDTWFHAEIVSSGSIESDSIDHGGVAADSDSSPRLPNEVSPLDCASQYRVVKNGCEPVHLRLDQILASRSWGIGFVFDDQDETDRLVTLMTRNVLRRFAQDLNDLASLLPRVLRAAPDRFPRLVPPRSGRAFEQLITDMLNEDGRRAQLSGLCEDYLQKTDIRVKYPDLDRRRGARVQVTIASSETNHSKKVSGIRHPEQFVILSPWSLASAVPQLGDRDREEKRALFGDELIRRFWECIPGSPSDLEGLSKQIKKVLCAAIDKPIDDPRGPLIDVPEPLRQFIRVWVHAEALRSTRALRLYEATEGRYRRGRDGRLRIRRLSETTLRQASLDFIKQHPCDSTVRAVIKRFTKQAAWVEFAEDLHGRVDRKEISWSNPNAEPQRYLQLGREYEFRVRRVSASRTPAVIELSLKRTIEDPWRPDNLPYLAGMGVVEGRIVHCGPAGLLIELDRDLVGLLHVSQLPPAVAESIDTAFSIDQTLPVTIDSINLAARKMSLALADELQPSKPGG